MFSKCGNGMDLSSLVSKSLWFVVYVFDRRGYLFWTFSYVASQSITVGYYMNMHSGCRWDIALPSPWGQVIYRLLVCSLMASGTHAINACNVAYIYHLCFDYQSYLSWDDPICLTWCELYPFNYGINLLLWGDLLITCASKWIWYQNIQIVLNTLHLLPCCDAMIKFSLFPKMHLAVTKNYQKSFASMPVTRVSLLHSQ